MNEIVLARNIRMSVGQWPRGLYIRLKKAVEREIYVYIEKLKKKTRAIQVTCKSHFTHADLNLEPVYDHSRGTTIRNEWSSRL